MTALDSFESLIDFAANGREYRHDEVWVPQPEFGDEAQQIVGTGFDFEKPMTVPDSTEDGNVEGTVHFRALRLTNGEVPRLLLRTRLEWTTSSGINHMASAYYELSREDVEKLDVEATPPTADSIDAATKDFDEKFGNPEDVSMDQASEILGMLFESILSTPNSHCNAGWNHSWSNEITEEESLGSTNLEARVAESDAEGEYHVNVIYDLFRREEPLACMLSDTEFGAVYAAELITLDDWVQNNVTV